MAYQRAGVLGLAVAASMGMMGCTSDQCTSELNTWTSVLTCDTSKGPDVGCCGAIEATRGLISIHENQCESVLAEQSYQAARKAFDEETVEAETYCQGVCGQITGGYLQSSKCSANLSLVSGECCTNLVLDQNNAFNNAVVFSCESLEEQDPYKTTIARADATLATCSSTNELCQSTLDGIDGLGLDCEKTSQASACCRTRMRFEPVLLGCTARIQEEQDTSTEAQDIEANVTSFLDTVKCPETPRTMV